MRSIIETVFDLATITAFIAMVALLAGLKSGAI